MINGIKFASVPVTDQDRALEFYTEKLGFKILTDSPFDDNQRWIELGIPGSDSRMVLFTPEGHEDRIGSFQNITFFSRDVAETYKDLVAKGVEFTQPPDVQEWGTYSLFKDPDGNVFCLSSP